MKKYENTYYSKEHIGEVVTLYGWVMKKRNLGGLIFIDLRDRSGIIQLVVRPESDVYKICEDLKNEYVIKATGKIMTRESVNPNLKTGEIEVDVLELEVLNTSLDVPFQLTNDTTALEDTRLKYRYLDLRREKMQNILRIRHNITMAIRNFLDKEGFLEVETPVLCKSTPEGARDYLVPSRVNKGSFWS